MKDHFLWDATTERGARFCVPTALHAITGLGARNCRALCEKTASQTLPQGIAIKTYEDTLCDLGYQIVSTKYDKPIPLTQVKTDRRAIVVIKTGPRKKHAVAFHNGYVCDNHYPKPLKLSTWIRKRGKGTPLATHITEVYFAS